MADRTWTGRIVLKGEKKGVSSAFSGASKNVDGFSKSLKRLGAVAGIAGVGAILKSTANTIRVFEKSISDLSAITGATGAKLERLAEASKRIGQTTTLSASQAAEAFKLMASAQPQLLDNVDALEATTLAAVTLAEAAGLELPAATAALGESMNQFGADASQATRFINVLAAGAKFGSSEINETALALKNAGTVASLAGLSFEKTNAAIQAMAAGGVKGAEAGSKLRAVLIKLQVQANDKFNPAVTDMSDVLRNLEEANLSVTEKVKIFGLEGLATADLLVAQRDVYDSVALAVTGTNEAYEQAQKRTDNLDGSIKRLTSAFEAVQLSFMGAAGPMRVVVDVLADIANTIALLNSDTDDSGISVTSALFEGLAIALKTTFTAGVVLKNMLDTVVDILGFIGKSLASLIQGDFDLLDDHFRDLKDNLQSTMDDIGAGAAGVWNPELAAKVAENMRTNFMAPAVMVAQETGEAIAQVLVTAGDEARAAAVATAAADLASEQEKEAERIERMRSANRSRMEVAVEMFNERFAQNLELLELEVITEDQFNERKIENIRAMHETIGRIQATAAARNLTFESMTAKQKTNLILGEAIRLSAGVAQQSKTMFKVNKAAALAQATVALPSAVLQSFQNAGGYPWGIIPAGLMLATGLSQIQAIKSTTFSGGGGGTTPSAAGGTSTVNSIPIASEGGGVLPTPFDVGGGGPGSGRSTQVTIRIDGLPSGGPVPAEMVRELIEGINEQLGDGVHLDTSAGGGG